MIAPGTWCLLLVHRRKCFATWRLARLPKPVISQAATAFVEDVFRCCKLLGQRGAATWQYFLGSVWLNAQNAEGELISWLSSEKKHKKQSWSWRSTRLFLFGTWSWVGTARRFAKSSTCFSKRLTFSRISASEPPNCIWQHMGNKWQPLQRQNLELWTSFVFAVFGRWGTARSILWGTARFILRPEALQDAIQSWLNSWLTATKTSVSGKSYDKYHTLLTTLH